MDMVRLGRSFEFHAAHRLSGHRGKCRHIHGHNFRVDITIEGDRNYLDRNGMMLDFDKFKEVYEETIRAADHTWICAAGDAEAIKSGSAYVLPPGIIPSVEGLAVHFRDVFEKRLEVVAPQLRLFTLRVAETERGWAEVKGKLNH